MSTSAKIIGLAGTFASGKDTLAQHLAAHYRFYHVSTGDIIREETQALYGRTDRDILVEHGNKLRTERGPGVLVEIAVDRYTKVRKLFPGGLVVSGIRSIGEAEALKSAGGTMVFVDAPIELRYLRIRDRNRDQSDQLTIEEFKATEERELDKPLDNKVDQNILGVKTLADLVLENGADLGAFLKDAESKLQIS